MSEHSFRRAVAAATRAVSRNPKLEVTFGERPARDGSVVLAQPKSLDPTSVAYARGSADAAAVKLRYHDPQKHERHLPESALARELLNAAEQARVEALGGREFAGVGWWSSTTNRGRGGGWYGHSSLDDDNMRYGTNGSRTRESTRYSNSTAAKQGMTPIASSSVRGGGRSSGGPKGGGK